MVAFYEYLLLFMHIWNVNGLTITCNTFNSCANQQYTYDKTYSEDVTFNCNTDSSCDGLIIYFAAPHKLTVSCWDESCKNLFVYCGIHNPPGDTYSLSDMDVSSNVNCEINCDNHATGGNPPPACLNIYFGCRGTTISNFDCNLNGYHDTQIKDSTMECDIANNVQNSCNAYCEEGCISSSLLCHSGSECTSEGTISTTIGITYNPTKSPTNSPTQSTTYPTKAPTVTPTNNPTTFPTVTPTNNPTSTPTEPGQTRKPSVSPTDNPTNIPTQTTNDPTTHPSKTPTKMPSVTPTIDPTTHPSETPTNDPTTHPSVTPTTKPSDNPTESPTDYEFCLDNDDNINAGFKTLNNKWSNVICEFCVCRDHTVSNLICDVIDFNNLKSYDSYLIDTFMQKCQLDQECSFKQVGLKRPSEEITTCNCDLFQCNPQGNNANKFIFGILVVLEAIIVMFSL